MQRILPTSEAVRGERRVLTTSVVPVEWPGERMVVPLKMSTEMALLW